MKRRRMNKYKDRKIFSSTASKVNVKNHMFSNVKRGGIRL